jgi:regulator of replication initiation timing
MVYYLFQNIHDLENKIDQIRKDFNDLRDDLSMVLQECKVKKDKKEKIQESFKNLLCKLDIECQEPFFNPKFNRYVLSYKTLLQI